MYRLLFLLAAAAIVGATSPEAHAQARFLTECAVATETPEFDSAALCSCAAGQAMAAGVPGADLDRLMDYVVEGELNQESVPDDLMPAASGVTGALVGCFLQTGMSELTEQLGDAMAESMASAMSEGIAAGGTSAGAGQVIAAEGGTEPEQVSDQQRFFDRARGLAPGALTQAGDATDAVNATIASAGETATTARGGTAAGAGGGASAGQAGPTVRVEGVHTGQGRPPTQAVQAGPGSAIRIVQ
ncbi:MAG: hypothetical protein AAGK21_07890 [Bacteroidota bacterium]